jgi:hypothetical protein
MGEAFKPRRIEGDERAYNDQSQKLYITKYIIVVNFVHINAYLPETMNKIRK